MSIGKVIQEELRILQGKNNNEKYYYPPKSCFLTHFNQSINRKSSSDRKEKLFSLKSPRTPQSFLPFVQERDHLGKLIRQNEHEKQKPQNFKPLEILKTHNKPPKHLIPLESFNDYALQAYYKKAQKSPTSKKFKKAGNSVNQSLNASLIYPSTPIERTTRPQKSFYDNSLHTLDFDQKSPCNKKKFDYDRFKLKPLVQSKPQHHTISPKNHKSPCFLSTSRATSLFERPTDVPFGNYDIPGSINLSRGPIFSNTSKVGTPPHNATAKEEKEFRFHEAFDKFHRRKVSVPNFSKKGVSLSTKNVRNKSRFPSSDMNNVDNESTLEESKYRKELFQKDMKPIETRLKLDYILNTKNLPLNPSNFEEKFRQTQTKHNINSSGKYR